jgi:2-polyprenyl-3-methyl-5-hydroxy-6-metoxy-1,4-benzoquinol methylase
MGQEANSSVYDALHAQEELFVPVRKSFYYALYSYVVDEVERRGLQSVIEVGCGTGALAELLMSRTPAQYHGFDFSTVGVQAATKRTGRADAFFVADGLDPASYKFPYTGIICTEVLEHITRDLDVVALWRSGAQCICSVPNFDYPTHVRHFRHEDEVRARYGDLIEIEKIARVAKPVFAGVTVREYLRKVRWARAEPKKMLGLLGIGTFDNLAGWFVFAGRRR